MKAYSTEDVSQLKQFFIIRPGAALRRLRLQLFKN